MPKRDDSPVTGIASKANFITANAVDTILAVPRRLKLPEVNYLEKEDYGQVPKYLQQVRRKWVGRIMKGVMNGRSTNFPTASLPRRGFSVAVCV